MEPIQVLVADDNELMRLGIVTLINTQADLKVVGQAGDGPEAVRLYDEVLPHVLVTDLQMPHLDGAQVTDAVLRKHPRAAVLVLTKHDGGNDILRALRAGAKGYVTKNIVGDELLRAIREIHAGRPYLLSTVSQRLAEEATRPQLSARELDVLQSMFAGQTDKEIAVELRIASKTVSMHVAKILSKLDARNRTEAVSVALHRGILTL